MDDKRDEYITYPAIGRDFFITTIELQEYRDVMRKFYADYASEIRMDNRISHPYTGVVFGLLNDA